MSLDACKFLRIGLMPVFDFGLHEFYNSVFLNFLQLDGVSLRSFLQQIDKLSSYTN